MIEFLSELWGDSFGTIADVKSMVELVAGNPKFLWTLISIGFIYHKASKINVREETIAEFNLSKEKKKRLKRYVGCKMQTLKDIFWHGLDCYREEMDAQGISKVQVVSGSDVLSGKPVTDVKRDYYSAVKDEVGVPDEKVTMKDRIVEKVIDRKSQIKDDESRTKFIEELAKDERAMGLSRIHKRSNYNNDLVKMEDEHLPFDVLKDIINDIVTHAEMLDGVENEKIEKLRKSFKVSPLSVVKIAGAVISKLRETRWKKEKEQQ